MPPGVYGAEVVAKIPKTVYERLLQMAEEESVGQKEISVKHICGDLVARFRLNKKEVYKILRASKFGEFKKNTIKLA